MRDDEPFYLKFAPDKTFNGALTGNNLTGSYETDGSGSIQIAFETEKVGNNSYSGIDFLDYLRVVEAFAITGDDLKLYRDGASHLLFKRHDENNTNFEQP